MHIQRHALLVLYKFLQKVLGFDISQHSSRFTFLCPRDLGVPLMKKIGLQC